MQPKLKLSINEPCHKNWQNMNPTEQGRHCSSCAKEVIDFTAMTDTEVLHYFINKKKENVCGRFYNDQLNREIKRPEYEKRKMMWYWNYLVMLFLLLFKGNTSKSQSIVKIQQPLEQQTKIDIEKQLTGVLGGVTINNDKKFDVSGKITDGSGNPVGFASVIIKGTKIGTQTNTDGVYKLKGVSKKDVLVISAVGYTSVQVKVNNSLIYDYVLQQMQLMGDVIVTVGYTTSDYDYSPPAIPTHVTVIEVKDNKTSVPVKAKLTIKNDNESEENISTTNKNGIYKLRRIKETENYTVTVSAEGYKDSVLQIKGCNFYERKETKYVFLEKEEKEDTTQESRTIILGGAISTFNNEPLYIVDGEISDKRQIADLKPGEIESIDVLKEAAATALCGSGGTSGVIIITTKKKLVIENNNPTKRPETTEEKIISTKISNIKIAPNPVQKGSSFTLTFTTKKDDDYVVNVFSINGVLMQSQKITAKANKNLLQVQVGAEWSAGIYYISINDTAGSSVNTAAFAVE